MTQRAFGEIGGVEPNAQGKYESGERTPKADYLSAVAEQGVDVLYVLTGDRTPTPLEGLTQTEEKILNCYRLLHSEDQEALRRLVTTLAQVSGNNPAKAKAGPDKS